MNRSKTSPAHMVYRRDRMNRLTAMMDMRLEFADLGDLLNELSDEEVDRFTSALRRENIARMVIAVDREHADAPQSVVEWWDAFVMKAECNPDETGDLDWSGLEL